MLHGVAGLGSYSRSEDIAELVKSGVQSSSKRARLFPVGANAELLNKPPIKDATYIASPDIWLVSHNCFSPYVRFNACSMLLKQ
jgi:hypothetical protein